jgi:hypothetical protein
MKKVCMSLIAVLVAVLVVNVISNLHTVQDVTAKAKSRKTYPTVKEWSTHQGDRQAFRANPDYLAKGSGKKGGNKTPPECDC